MDTPVHELTLEELDRALEKTPDSTELLIVRGKRYYQEGRFDRAYNDFNHILTLDPTCQEAQNYVSLLQEIFAFRYTDLYNP